MSVEQLSTDDWDLIRKKMDSDGNGVVTKDEFKKAYGLIAPEMSDGELDELWKKADNNEDGSLSIEELKAFFGVTEDKGMSDDDLLKALSLSNSLSDVVPTVTYEVKPAVFNKDLAEMINFESRKTDMETPPNKLLFACYTNDLKIVKDVLDQHPDVNVRLRGKDGQMPIHMLCNTKFDATKEDLLTECFERVMQLSIAQLKASHPDLPPTTDVNQPDSKSGATPLLMAIEKKHRGIVSKLILKYKADPMVMDKNKWSILHKATYTNGDTSILTESRLKDFLKAMLPVLLVHQNSEGRNPMHNAAMYAEPETVQQLIDLGGSVKGKDKAGNDAAGLATRTGRRRSRELLEKAK